jgi:hypothetical protein
MIPKSVAIVRSKWLLVVLVSALVAVAPGTSLAFDGSTFAAWHSTWHGPNALESPLRTYYIPRSPGHCDRPAYSEGFECTEFNDNGPIDQGSIVYGTPCDLSVALSACSACLSVRSERLGQIPNDLEAAASVPVGAPGR